MTTDSKALTGKKFRCTSLKENKYVNWSYFFQIGEVYEETVEDKFGVTLLDEGDGALLLNGFLGVGIYVDEECFELISIRHEVCMN